MDGIRCKNYEDFETAAAGAFWLAHAKSGDEDVYGLHYKCPCCGRHGYLPLNRDRAATQQPSWDWNGDVQNPTLSPSILSQTSRGGCGWHGYLRSGRWETC